MDKRSREWPTCAMHARDEAAEAILAATQDLNHLVNSNRALSETEIIRRTSRALANTERALRLLAQVGARIRNE